MDLPSGTFLFENWRAHSSGAPPVEIFEFPIYTDAWITGDVAELGPYKVFNTIAHSGMQFDVLKPTLVARVERCLEYAVPSYTGTTSGSYHGGGITDEIAAFVSLVLGIRAQAGFVTREFMQSDPRGVPVA